MRPIHPTIAREEVSTRMTVTLPPERNELLFRAKLYLRFQVSKLVLKYSFCND